MQVLDPRTATGAVSPWQPLDGRPLPGKPGGGSATSWGATETFFSMLTQCGLTPVKAPEPAPATALAAGQAGPLIALPTEDPTEEAAADAASLADSAPQAPLAAATATSATAPAASAAPADLATLPAVNDVTTVPAILASAGFWPGQAAGGPTAAARPIKPPILSGYRTWSTPAEASARDPESSAAASSEPGVAARPTNPATAAMAACAALRAEGVTPAPAPEPAAAAAKVTPDLVSPDLVSPDLVSPDLAADALTAAPPTVAPAGDAAPVPPAEEAPAPATAVQGGESAGASTDDPGSAGQHPPSDPQAASTDPAPATTAPSTATGVTASVVAAATAAELAVLMGTEAAAGRATSLAGTAPGTGDPATSASIRAQVLAEVAMQSVGATGHEKITLQLEPEHLGKVQVQLQARGTRLEIVIQAQSPEAEQALSEGAQDLVEAIVGRGEGRWQQVEVRFERSSNEREQRQPKDEPRDGGGSRRDNQQDRRRDERAEG